MGAVPAAVLAARLVVVGAVPAAAPAARPVVAPQVAATGGPGHEPVAGAAPRLPTTRRAHALLGGEPILPIGVEATNTPRHPSAHNPKPRCGYPTAGFPT